jgi:hypothetical protein
VLCEWETVCLTCCVSERQHASHAGCCSEPSHPIWNRKAVGMWRLEASPSCHC